MTLTFQVIGVALRYAFGNEAKPEMQSKDNNPIRAASKGVCTDGRRITHWGGWRKGWVIIKRAITLALAAFDKIGLVYQRGALSMRNMMKLLPVLVKLLTVFVTSLMFATGAISAEKSIIVFDASGSMWAQIDGKSRIEIARETIRSVIGTLPADKEIGLMAYGHREKGSCTDIELLVAPAAGTGAAIIAASEKINPKGKTPLSEAVKRAAEELKFTEEKATVILVTDGLETCNADPCALGNELEKAGVDFTAHVVGFGLSEEEGKKVACLAENTGGKYIQASDAGQLTEALKTTVVAAEPVPAPAPEPAKVEFNVIPTAVMAEGGEAVTPEKYGDVSWEFNKVASDGGRGERVTTEYNGYKGMLPAGDYILVARMDAAEAEQKITLSDDATLKPVVVMNAGLVRVTPYAFEGGDPSESASVEYGFQGTSTTSYGPNKIVLPAGDISVKVRIGQGEVTETIALKAGDVLDKKIVVGTGHVVANAFYVEGMKVDAPGMGIEVYSAKVKIDGSQDKVAYFYGADAKFDLPPGDYILRAKMEGAKGEVPFTVKAGERVEPIVVLNAGVVKVSAPGNNGWRFLSAKESLNGERDTFDYGYGDAFQTTLVAGDYMVETELKKTNEKKLTPITVKAGERLELTIQ